HSSNRPARVPNLVDPLDIYFLPPPFGVLSALSYGLFPLLLELVAHNPYQRQNNHQPRPESCPNDQQRVSREAHRVPRSQNSLPISSTQNQPSSALHTIRPNCYKGRGQSYIRTC
ncbi:hypothetical protein B0H66DRAFT_634283, partial [Apodospora peruviana]